jgi:endonuclease YncB( thermonuclease family)
VELFFLLLILALAVFITYRASSGDHANEKGKAPLVQKRSPNSQHRTRQKPESADEYNDGDHLTRTNGIDHAAPPPFPISMLLEGHAHVIDGDTIVVKKIKIRLAGIDAPELDRPWGQRSKWEMVRICKGHVIRVELTGDTSYDRLVGTCYLPDGTDIGAEIVKVGLALDGGYYSEGKYRHLEPSGIRRKLKPYGNKIRS